MTSTLAGVLEDSPTSNLKTFHFLFSLSEINEKSNPIRKVNHNFTPSKQNLSCLFKNKELKNKIDIENNCIIMETSVLMIILHKLPYTRIAFFYADLI